MIANDIALLAPVPWIHLHAALGMSDAEEVQFGSDAWELFAALDKIRSDESVDVFIVATMQHDLQPPGFEPFFRAVYIGWKQHEDLAFRPLTTASDSPFGVYWRIRNLRRLSADEKIDIGAMKPFGKSKAYGQPFTPHGPILIEHPLR